MEQNYKEAGKYLIFVQNSAGLIFFIFNVPTSCLFVNDHHVMYRMEINSDGNRKNIRENIRENNTKTEIVMKKVKASLCGLEADWRWTGSGEDVVGLLLHQHGHVLHVATPEVQPLLHPFDLKQQNKKRRGSSQLLVRTTVHLICWTLKVHTVKPQ